MEAPIAPSLAYFRRIWQLRWFWYSLVENDVATRYRHSVLGIGWSLMRPLGLTIIMCVVFGSLFQVPLQDYAPYVLVGLTLWQFVVECTTAGSKSFMAGAAYIRQQAAPLAIYPLRMVLVAAFHMVIALSLALIAVWIFLGIQNLAVLPAALPAVALFFVFGWSVAIVTSFAQTHFPDTCYALELMLQFTFYLTPIIYRPFTLQQRPGLAWIVDCNPIWSLLQMIREPVLYGNLPPLYNVIVGVSFVAAVAALALYCLRKMERTLVFWV